MVALERAKVKVSSYLSSEIDKYAIQISKKNYPDIRQVGDIRNIKNVLGVNLLIGGSPCQGLSFAGKQLNFDDPRSGLFFEFVRILEESNPEYFLLENVKMKKESQDIITNLLGVQPIQINSSSVSAHNRTRLYWTNIPNVETIKEKNVQLESIIESGFVDRQKSYCVDANYFKGGNLRSYFEKSRRQLVFLSEESYNSENPKYRKLTPLECERLQTLPDGYTEGVSNTQRYKALGNGWTVDVIAHILSYMKPKTKFTQKS